MRQFRFSLQAVLTVLLQREQAALETYAQAIADRQRSLEKVSDARRDCETAWSFHRQRLVSGASAAQVSQASQAGSAAKESLERCNEVLRRTQQIADAALNTLLAARQSREAVDKFRVRQQERHTRELRREEQKVIDDLAQHLGGRDMALSNESTGRN